MKELKLKIRALAKSLELLATKLKILFSGKQKYFSTRVRRFNDYSGIIAEFITLNDCKNIIEIGVNVGDTHIALCEAAKYTGGHVWGFDLWSVHGLYNQFPKTGDYEEVKDRLKKGGFDNSTLLRKNSFDKDFPEFLREKTGGKIDLAFIDGDHSYNGCLNDFKAVYPLLSPTGIVVFHDTQRIEGCREFVYDLRTKYFDGTYDVFDLFGVHKLRKMGITFLIKRQFPVLKIPINQLCGSPSTPYEIERKELSWYESELKKYEANDKITEVNVGNLPISPIENFRTNREYLSK